MIGLSPTIDDGCHVHPHCLTCWLPHCIYEDADGGRGMLMEIRNTALLKAYREEGLDVLALAKRFGMHSRRVYQIIKDAKK